MDPRHTAPPRDDPLFDEGPGHRAYDRGMPPPRSRRFDLAGLFVLLDSLRKAVPTDLEQRVTSLIREFLLTLRALIDWYLERLDRPSREPRVEDIPIE